MSDYVCHWPQDVYLKSPSVSKFMVASRVFSQSLQAHSTTDPPPHQTMELDTFPHVHLFSICLLLNTLISVPSDLSALLQSSEKTRQKNRHLKVIILIIMVVMVTLWPPGCHSAAIFCPPWQQSQHRFRLASRRYGHPCTMFTTGKPSDHLEKGTIY